MRLLLTNDDGIDAPGLAALEAACAELGTCTVVAPREPMSGVGHTLTTESHVGVRELAPNRFSVDGTPADCARLALTVLAGEVDWVVAGVNRGANLGVDTFVSGTVAAAREAAQRGVPALAISQYVGRYRDLDWARCTERSQRVLEPLLRRGVAANHFWNVNLPHPHDDAVAADVVHCPPDPSPHATRYERRGQSWSWEADFHLRPRLPGCDVDVCFGGRVAVSELPGGPTHRTGE
ncbi:MAG: 5'/3'-nucleotidase SurE [Proteobacteria bacterium]|nr:5'/3'-nucleotidase SurE [Pseudomonadota bacterium]